jgi:hypothetical protein
MAQIEDFLVLVSCEFVDIFGFSATSKVVSRGGKPGLEVATLRGS